MGGGGREIALVVTGSVPQFQAMIYSPPDVLPEVADLQVRRYRAMSPAEKLACADALWNLAWDATRAGVRMRHPDFDESAVTSAARAIFRGATD